MNATVLHPTLQREDVKVPTPLPSPDLATALDLIASLRSEIEDLLAQRNAAEETVRKYANQADIDRVTIQTWERLGVEWAKERSAFEARQWVLEKVAVRHRPSPVQVHIHVHSGGVVNVQGGSA
jgi:hypothetical protein